MKPRIALTYYSYLTIPWKDILNSIQAAEKEGFECVLLSESAYRDATVLLADVLSNTRRIRVGTNIVNIYSRTPTQIAMANATLNELYDGRVELLALGQSNWHWIEKFHGVKFEKTLLRAREYVEVIRALFSGNPVNYSGKYFNVQNVQFRTAPVRIPIYLGCTGPKMLGLTGEVADGVIFSSLASPEYAKYAVNLIREGAEKVGRDPRQIDIGCSVVLAASENEEAARQAAVRAFLYYVRIPEMKDFQIRKTGFDPKEFEELRRTYWGGDMMNAHSSPLETGNMKKAMSMVTDSMLSAFIVYGTPKHCRERLDDYAKAGVTFPVIRSAVDEETGIEAVLANIKAVSKLLK